jgi:hypothetical protein
VLLSALLLPASERAADGDESDGFKPMFNGKDLTGWVRVNNAPGTFFVKDKEVVTTGLPIGFMRTEKMYENFIADFEWKHLPPKPDAVGNSGFFVWCDPLPAIGSPFTRGIEVQVLVNLTYKDKKTGKVSATSHGDLFSIWGATCVPDRPHPLGWARCLPSEDRAKGAGEWNHYRVEAKDGVIKLAVNGKVVSGVSKCKPRKGYLALEAEGSECRFRNFKIKELPTTDPKPEEVCKEAQDFTTVFTGLNLDGWDVGADQKSHWKVDPIQNMLTYDGKVEEGGHIITPRKYGDFEMILDVRLPKDASKTFLALRGNDRLNADLTKGEPGKWNRFTITCKGGTVTTRLGKKVLSEVTDKEFAQKAPIQLGAHGPASFCNLFLRELK